MSSGLPEPSRTGEELQPGNVGRNAQVREKPVCVCVCVCLCVFGCLIDVGFECVMCCLIVCLLRTLLALGCHVGMGDEKAEENLKRIKLPKTSVTHTHK